jgi:hypothetical protein
MSESASRIVLPDAWIKDLREFQHHDTRNTIPHYDQSLKNAIQYIESENNAYLVNGNESAVRLRKVLLKFDLVCAIGFANSNESNVLFADWLATRLNDISLPRGSIRLAFDVDGKDAEVDIGINSPHVLREIAHRAGATIVMFIAGTRPQVFETATSKFTIGILATSHSILGCSEFFALIPARQQTPKRPSRKKKEPPDASDEVMNQTIDLFIIVVALSGRQTRKNLGGEPATKENDGIL